MLLRENALKRDPRLVNVFNAIETGTFGPADVFKPLLDSLAAGNGIRL